MDLHDVHNARFTQPTEEELNAYMAQQFGTAESSTDDPAAVSAALMEPFPQEAIFKDDKGMAYVKYQQVIRRLIHATGNNFSTQVLSVSETPWGTSKRGVEQVLIEATASLTIPVLNSTRTHRGVQVASVGYGEDMRKGAVSDAIKKAAQQFGVAIDLAGADGEDTAPHDPGLEMAKDIGVVHQSATRAPQQRQAPAPQQQQNAPQRPAQQATGASGNGPTEPQKKALYAVAMKNGGEHLLDQWAQEFGAANQQALTKRQASDILTKYGS